MRSNAAGLHYVRESDAGHYFEGHLNGTYSAGVKDTGGGSVSTEHIAKSRWGFKLVSQEGETKSRNYHKTADEIIASASERPGKLFHLEIGKTVGGTPGFVTHMALMFGDAVYECTPKPILNGSACLKRSLADFMANKGGSIIYMFAEP